MNKFPTQLFNLMANRRLTAVFFLAFSSGLPIALVGSTLQAWYTVAGISIVTIGLLSLVGQPYAFKFLWAPLLDRYMPPVLGRRRGWILITQLGLALLFIFMSTLNPNNAPLLLACIALMVALLSATQDIAIDAYRIEILLSHERGLGAAFTTVGYRLAMLVSGGLALVLADHMGWHWCYLLMAILTLVCAMVTFFAPASQQAVLPSSLKEAVLAPWMEFLTRDYAYLILIFIILYKLGDAFTVSLSSVFFIRGLGFSLTDVGVLYKGVGMAATILGALLGGVLLFRINLYQALLWFGLLQAISNLTFLALAIVGKNYSLLIAAIFSESFCGGLSTTALVSFLMSLCDIRYTATQFALLASLASVGRVFVGPIAGLMIESLGWVQFFIWSFVLCFPSLGLLAWLKNRVNFAVKS